MEPEVRPEARANSGRWWPRVAAVAAVLAPIKDWLEAPAAVRGGKVRRVPEWMAKAIPVAPLARPLPIMAVAVVVPGELRTVPEWVVWG